MNIEDIFCQIVMRKQRNNQLLRELEASATERNEFLLEGDDTQDMLSGSRQNSMKPGSKGHSTCIPVKDVEILGPDYCSKRPVFLPLHFPEMLVNSQQA